MSKQDNLTDFLTDVADAIREKKGTTEKINPQNFSEEIRSIESGGGLPQAEWNDVNFYDYDGTRLYSYTWEEAMAMTELPPLPTQKGLICQEWNYTLEDIKAQNGACDVGATYITDDGNTRFYLTIKNERAKDVSLHFPRYGGVTVDWGDGTSVETTEKELSHQYAEYGEYVVAFKPKTYIAFELDVNRNVLGYNLAPSSERYDSLTKVEFGSSISNLGNFTFDNCSSLRTVTIPNTTITMGAGTFRNCTSLKCVVMPKGLNSISTNVFQYCASLKIVSLSKGLTKYDTNMFNSCSSLQRVVVPVGVTNLSSNTFATATSLSRVVIPDGVTGISNSVFNSCFRLQCLKIPASVTTLGVYALYNLSSIAYIDFSSHTTIPTLSSSSSIAQLNTGTKIIVPDNLYDEWIVATNWSTLSSYIVRTSEYFYIDFADPVVEKICAENFGDGVGVTQAQANKVTTFPVIFQNNAEITSFDEFERFENVTDLGFEAFRACTSLSSITFPNLKKLPANVFLGCSSLDIDINLPSLMTISGDRQFNKSAIRRVTSLGSITSLSAAMFENCTNLIEVIIPSTCTTIHISAFYGCTALQSIVCNPTTPPVLDSVIPNQSTVYVPDESVDAYKSATNWSGYADRIKPISEYQPITE